MSVGSAAKDPRPTLCIDGRAHRNWLRYNVSSGFFVPADSWSVGLGFGQKENPSSWIKLWAEVELFFDGKLALTGRIDRLRRDVTKGECRLELSGRDNAGLLLDCSAPIFVKRTATLPELVATVVRPLGVKDIDIDVGASTLFRKVTVEPGMTAWEVVQEAANANGLWARFSPKGVLTLGRPDYSAPPVAELKLTYSGVGNNVLELSVEENVTRQYSTVTVLSQTQGNELTQAINALQAVAVDSEAPFRPKLLRKGHLDNLLFTKNVAKGYLEEGKFKGFSVYAKVQGHSANAGVLWEPGQRARVVSEPHGIDEVFLITNRSFTGGRLGSFTNLTLQKDGVWLAD